MNRKRADAARAADDEDRVRCARHRHLHVEAVEQHFPGGQRRQRHRGCLRVAQRLRLVADDALVDELKFGVAAGADIAAGVIDFVASLEERHVRADLANDAGCVVTQHAQTARVRCEVHAHLGVDRIDGHGLHFDEEVAAGGLRLVDVEIDQAVGVGNRSWAL